MTGDYEDGGGIQSLSEEHSAVLKASSINDEMIIASGCFTVYTLQQVKRLGFPALQASKIPLPAIAFPAHDVNGMALAADLRPNEPRLIDGKPVKYERPAKHKNTLYVPPPIRAQIGNPSVPIWFTEGQKKALSAASRGICCISISGVWNWKGTNKDGGKTVLSDFESIALNGRRVYIAFDSDYKHNPSVFAALVKLKSWLESKGALVLVIELPPMADGRKQGLDDFFASGKTETDAVALAISELPDIRAIRAHQEAAKPPTSGLPVIETNDSALRDLTTESMSAVVAANNPPKVFVRGGQLVRIVTDEECKPIAQPLTQDAMRGILARVAEYVSTSEKRGSINVYPPAAVVADVMALSEWPELPALSGIVTAPVFATDGNLCDVPGYHQMNRIYYHQYEGFSLPDTTPTPANVAAALHLLQESLLVDFPFADQASRANAMALMLLPYVRYMISGPTPLHVIGSPAAGTGKTMLADACALAFIPQGLAIMTAPVKEEEWAKSLLSTLIGSPSHVLIGLFLHNPRQCKIRLTLYH